MSWTTTNQQPKYNDDDNNNSIQQTSKRTKKLTNNLLNEGPIFRGIASMTRCQRQLGVSMHVRVRLQVNLRGQVYLLSCSPCLQVEQGTRNCNRLPRHPFTAQFHWLPHAFRNWCSGISKHLWKKVTLVHHLVV
eukprot:986218-Amphidinium_carterae.1